MARMRMVTRTITAKEVDFLTVNTKTAETAIKTVVVPNMEDDKIVKYAHKHLNNGDTVFVAAQSIRTIEELYGMPESKFIELAEKLPPRTVAADNE